MVPMRVECAARSRLELLVAVPPLFPPLLSRCYQPDQDHERQSNYERIGPSELEFRIRTAGTAENPRQRLARGRTAIGSRPHRPARCFVPVQRPANSLMQVRQVAYATRMTARPIVAIWAGGVAAFAAAG